MIVRVDYSLTKKAHSPTPGQYMGPRRRRDRYDRHDRYDRYDRYDDHRGGYRRDRYGISLSCPDFILLLS